MDNIYCVIDEEHLCDKCGCCGDDEEKYDFMANMMPDYNY